MKKRENECAVQIFVCEISLINRGMVINISRKLHAELRRQSIAGQVNLLLLLFSKCWPKPISSGQITFGVPITIIFKKNKKQTHTISFSPLCLCLQQSPSFPFPSISTHQIIFEFIVESVEGVYEVLLGLTLSPYEPSKASFFFCPKCSEYSTILFDSYQPNEVVYEKSACLASMSRRCP